MSAQSVAQSKNNSLRRDYRTIIRMSFVLGLASGIIVSMIVSYILWLWVGNYSVRSNVMLDARTISFLIGGFGGVLGFGTGCIMLRYFIKYKFSG